MKHAYWKEVFRQVRTMFLRFTAIVAIVMLGVAFFSGIRATCPDMQETANRYYSAQNLMDLRLRSTVGFSDEDVAALRQVQGVQTLETQYTAEAFWHGQEDSWTLRLYSYDAQETINRPKLKEGTLPAKSGECAVDARLLTFENTKIGDKITLTGAEDPSLAGTLRRNEYTVTALVELPQYIGRERGSSSIGKGICDAFVLLPKSDFNLPVFTDITVTVDREGHSRFSEAYDERVTSVKEALKAEGDTRAAAWLTEKKAEGADSLQKAKAELAAEEKKLRDEEKKLVDARAALEEQKKLYAENRTDMLAQSGATEAMVDAALAASKAQMDEAEAALQVGETELATAKAQAEPELQKARDQIDKAQQQLDELETPGIYVLDNHQDPSFEDYYQNTERVASIGNVFPLIFFIVAALVCLTNMTRMVDDDRMVIGTMKALGYSRARIANKYILFALMASVLGSVLGAALGLTLLPFIISNAYGILYDLPKTVLLFNAPYTLLACVGAIACAVLPAYLVCLKDLHDTPAALMLPKAPPKGKRILLERIKPIWKRLSFSYKVTMRNLFRYKKRFLMTIIGIAGCTALIFTGFGLRDSVTRIVDMQFAQLRHFDMQMALKDDLTAEQETALRETLQEDENVTQSLFMREKSVDVQKGNTLKTVQLEVPAEPERLPDFINQRTRKGHKPVALTQEGVLLSEKLAKQLDCKVGDEVRIQNTRGLFVPFTVAGIFENYASHFIYMTPELYENQFGETFRPNQVINNLQDTSEAAENATGEKLLQEGVVQGVAFMNATQDTFANMIHALDYVVVVLVLSAAALAFVVLFSLTNINIEERIRELATIKVLGFFDKEVSSYVYRENVMMTLLSSLVGLGLGVLLHRYVIFTAEMDFIMFAREPLVWSYFYAIGMTVAFTLLVNVLTTGRLRKINMVEALKSVE